MDDQTPEAVTLTPEDAQALKTRILNSSLPEDDAKLLTGLISFSLWMHTKLASAELTIMRLRRFFGIKTEKKTLQIAKRFRRKK